MPVSAAGKHNDSDDDFVSIIFVRHGKSVAQEQKQARRHVSMRDAPMSTSGRKQAEALAHSIGNFASADDDTLIVSSPLTRALQTAVILRKGHSSWTQPIQAHHGLAEHGAHMRSRQLEAELAYVPAGRLPHPCDRFAILR